MIPIFVALFFMETVTGQWIAFTLFALASLTDFLDGYLARRRSQLSAFGKFLDPVADKLLVASALLMLVAFNQISGAVVIPAVTILCREILVSGLREYLAGFEVRLPVSRLAKWKTTIQMIAIGLLIIGNVSHPTIPDIVPIRLIGESCLWIAALVTLITGFKYLRTGLQTINSSGTL